LDPEQHQKPTNDKKTVKNLVDPKPFEDSEESKHSVINPDRVVIDLKTV